LRQDYKDAWRKIKIMQQLPNNPRWYAAQGRTILFFFVGEVYVIWTDSDRFLLHVLHNLWMQILFSLNYVLHTWFTKFVPRTNFEAVVWCAKLKGIDYI
jgi:hypothetical protein